MSRPPFWLAVLFVCCLCVGGNEAEGALPAPPSIPDYQGNSSGEGGRSAVPWNPSETSGNQESGAVPASGGLPAPPVPMPSPGTSSATGQNTGSAPASDSLPPPPPSPAAQQTLPAPPAPAASPGAASANTQGNGSAPVSGGLPPPPPAPAAQQAVPVPPPPTQSPGAASATPQNAGSPPAPPAPDSRKQEDVGKGQVAQPPPFPAAQQAIPAPPQTNQDILTMVANFLNNPTSAEEAMQLFRTADSRQNKTDKEYEALHRLLWYAKQLGSADAALAYGRLFDPLQPQWWTVKKDAERALAFYQSVALQNQEAQAAMNRLRNWMKSEMPKH